MIEQEKMFLGYIDPGSGFTIFNLGGWLIAVLISFLSLFLLLFKKIGGFFKKNWKIGAIILLITFILGLIIRGVIMSKKESKFNKRLIMLGFDGLSPDIIEPMMKEGSLPSFASLKEQGSYRRLTTTNPSQSPVAWAAFATGQNPGKNGVFDFIIRDPRTYALTLSLSDIQQGRPRRVIKSKCFWQYTSEAQIPAIIINCPVTFPPDKIFGRMLSGMGVPDILGTEGTFSFFTTERLSADKEIGGRVFCVKKSPVMTLDLIGPRVSNITGNAENIKVPMKVSLAGKDSIVIEYQNNKFELEKGSWSGWKEVTFALGLLKETKGIFKFYLAETQPEFKLYISPINFDPREPFFQISYPKAYSRELADNIGLYYTQGTPIDTWVVNEERLTEESLLDQADGILREKKKMLDFELERFEKGVFFFYLGSTDTIQHMFWRYTDPQHPLYRMDSPKGYKDAIKNWYKKMDDILGDVMKRLNKDDVLIVFSDHGFNTFRRAAHINSWLNRNGYLELKGPLAESGVELLKDVDWLKTKAYAIGFGAVYINQKGRERDGIVKPGAETEALKEEIYEKLKQWRDEKYDSPVVNNVYKQDEIFQGGYAKGAPDLYVGFNIGYRASWQTALGAVPKELIEDNLKKWSGDHLFDPGLMPGIIFSNKQIEKKNPSIYDIAPTILKIIGCDEAGLKKCDFDGKPLF